MRGTNIYREQGKEVEKPKLHSLLLNVILVVAVAVVSYYLANLAIDRFDLYRELGLDTFRIPELDATIPKWVLQAVLTLLLFFFLRPLLVILFDLVVPKTQEVDEGQFYKNPWEQ